MREKEKEEVFERSLNLRLAHLDAADIGALEMSLTTSACKHLSFQHNVLGIQVGSKFGSLFGALGNAELRSWYTMLVQKTVTYVLVHVQIPRWLLAV